MKQTLIIGSTVLDIILDVTGLPRTAQDLHIKQQTMVLGGCAFNVQNIVQLFQVPHLFCSPIGTGVYGDYVAKQLTERGLDPFIRIKEQDSGCCYCYVEPDGERTFLSYHGAEYTFQEKWLNHINMKDYDSAYICGLEIEEPTGDEIVSFLKKNKNLEIYFAPGPRFPNIEKNKLDELFLLSPVVHLNREEIMTYTKKETLEQAATALYARSHNTVIITDGDNGSFVFDDQEMHHIPVQPTKVVDTIGAGDSHIGAIIACRKLGYSYVESLSIANKISAKVVATKGSTLPVEDFPFSIGS
ncbi:carbohydrate kinase family protein [Gottschalkiaceae bacterium SANA]|nr:carbohydrate kinase family protein [Gottschalkiaceae bacterium SANA]